MPDWNASRDGNKLVETLEKILAEMREMNNQLRILGSTTEITNKVIDEFNRREKNR